jgi:hypothetical protein
MNKIECNPYSPRTGKSFLIAASDVADYRDSKILADTIIGNCNTKLLMKSVFEPKDNMPTQNTPSVQMTKQQMLDRVKVLSSEMDANEEENRVMQTEIDSLYSMIDGSK